MAERMSIEERIRHCLRLSEDASATQAERDLAGREAERLLAKHAIDRLDLDLEADRRKQHEPIETRDVVVAGGRGSTSLDIVLGLAEVARSLGLVPYYRDQRDAVWNRIPGEQQGVRLSISGFRSDVELAVPLLRSLQLQATVAVSAWWRSRPEHRRAPKWDAHLARCAFVRSFGSGAAARLRTVREEAATGGGKELVVAARDSEVRDWVQQHVALKQVRDRRSFTGYGRAPGYAAGLASGGTGASVGAAGRAALR